MNAGFTQNNRATYPCLTWVNQGKFLAGKHRFAPLGINDYFDAQAAGVRRQPEATSIKVRYYRNSLPPLALRLDQHMSASRMIVPGTHVDVAPIEDVPTIHIPYPSCEDWRSSVMNLILGLVSHDEGPMNVLY